VLTIREQPGTILDDELLGEVRPVIRLLLVASALVILVAIASVAALFLALG
jgi:hypothetical protein